MAVKKKKRTLSPVGKGKGRAVSKQKKPAPKKKPVHLTPVPESSTEVVLWFQALAGRVEQATETDLRVLIQEAQKFDLVGLSEALGHEGDVLALNRAANTLLDAAIEASPRASDRAHLLAVLRDILNDS
jgi:hypothetical protein